MKVSGIVGGALLAIGLAFPSAAQQAHDHSSHAGHSHGQAAQALPAGETPDFVRGDIVYGNADAPIEIIEYASLTCPHCKAFMDEVVPYLKEELIPSGKVRLIFRNFVLNRLDLAASVAARCTNDRELAKNLLESYFDKQAAWTSSNDPKTTIFAIANARGIENDDLEKCLQSQEIFEHIVAIARDGHEKYDIQGTPTVIMNGKKVSFKGFADLRAQIKAAVDAN